MNIDDSTPSPENLQTGMQTDAPFGDSRPLGRDGHGRWLPSNTGALKTGAYSERARHAELPEQAGHKATLDERRDQLVSDQGGPDDLSLIRRDAVERYLECDTLCRHVLNRVIQEGPFTPTGRQRGALQTYLQIVDRWHRLAVLLGLDRRERDLGDGTIQDWIAAQRQREARQVVQAPAGSPLEGQDDAGH